MKLVHVPFSLQLNINKYNNPTDAYFFTSPLPQDIWFFMLYAGQFKASAL